MKLKPRHKFRVALFLAAIFSVLFFVGCNKDDTDSSFKLHYADIVDMGQSMTFSSGAPSYYGPAPSDFAITSIKVDGTVVLQDGISIDPQSGEIKIENTIHMPVGVYKISISCMSQGKVYQFNDVISVEMLPSVPATISVTPQVVDISYSNPTGQESATVDVTSPTCAVLNYNLVQEEGKEYFTISKTGVITLNKSFEGEIPPGSYKLIVRAITKAGQAIFEDAVTFNITSAPLALTYTPAQGKMEFDMSYTGLAPAFKGSLNDLVYSIKSVTPATDKITINPETGVIMVAQNNNLPIGNSYKVSVTATNIFGTKDFSDVFTLEVIDFIEPISNFSYVATSQILATAWTVQKASNFAGDEVSFSIVSMPSALNGKITISAQTGDISALKANTIPEGDHTVIVRATNSKGYVDANLALTIAPNPNFFTRITYGNNLNLTPAQSYANQFMFNSAADQVAYGTITPTTDIPAGVTAEWSVTMKKYGSSTQVVIDAATGALTVTYYNATSIANVIYVMATTGKGTPAEVSVTVPVFFYYPQTFDGLRVTYAPFVFQVNPTKGGSSVAPTITGLTAGDKFIMEYRRNVEYFNFAGPASHINGLPTVVDPAKSFLNQMWTAYYTSLGKPVATGDFDPVRYSKNTGNISAALCYVSPIDAKVVVNPNKWVDKDGNPASGILYGQMTYAKDGDFNTAYNHPTNRIFPLFIWFDEKF